MNINVVIDISGSMAEPYKQVLVRELCIFCYRLPHFDFRFKGVNISFFEWGDKVSQSAPPDENGNMTFEPKGKNSTITLADFLANEENVIVITDGGFNMNGLDKAVFVFVGDEIGIRQVGTFAAADIYAAFEYVREAAYYA